MAGWMQMPGDCKTLTCTKEHTKALTNACITLPVLSCSIKAVRKLSMAPEHIPLVLLTCYLLSHSNAARATCLAEQAVVHIW